MSSPRHPLGQLVRDGDRIGLRFERDLAHPPERVWRALTERDELRHWMPCDMVGERAAGAEIRLPFWPDVAAEHGIEQPDLPGRIITWDPPRTFVWMWDTDELRFELTPTDAGTRLVFTTWIDKTPGVELTAAGYHVCFDQLAALLDDGAAPPFVEADPSAYERLYAPFAEANASVQ
jgi:uncharacterized protein YndB with AHSA1/START domain